MKAGFLKAVRAADGPRTRYFNKSDGTAAPEREDFERHIAELTASLREAESELRSRRADRLHVESGIDTAAGGATDALEQKSSVSWLPAELSEAALEALGSHQEPPPGSLHRLADCLILLLEAESLVSLGDHPLPACVPWKNIQTLLSRSSAQRKPSNLAAALNSEPHGERMRRSIRERLLGEAPLTRDEVEAADSECVCIYDFVKAFVDDAPGEGGFRPSATHESSADQSSSPSSPERTAAVAAVQEQEVEVSRIRRELRGARKRQHETESSAKDAEDRAVQEAVAKKHAVKEAHILQDEERESKREEAKLLVNASEASVTEQEQEAPTSYVRSIEYRLAETEVQPLQEAVLYSMLNALAEPRLACYRTVEITGFSEVREEGEVAQARGAKVYEWLVAHGAVEEQLVVTSARPDEKRGSRRTELRLIDRSGRCADAAAKASRVSHDDETIRAHGQNIMKGTEEGYPDGPLAGAPADRTEEESPRSLTAKSPEAQDGLGADVRMEVEEVRLSPHVLVEEVSEDLGTGAQLPRLRVTFASADLDASDCALELGELAVRLASASNLWREVEAVLPFAVDPATATPPKFSRKKGTLTLYLQAA